MRNKFYIIVKPEQMHRYENGNVMGIICCQYGTEFFPEDVWDDFIVTILDWWIQASLRLLLQTSDYEELSFMDGPFEMSLENLDKSKYKMTWIDEEQDRAFSFALDLKDFTEELAKATDMVIGKCQKEKWESDDLASLVKNYQSLLLATASMRE